MTITVDMLCVGHGAGTLGAAVLAARRNMSVMYVDSLPGPRLSRVPDRPLSPWTRALADRWELNALSPETRSYLTELTIDLAAPDAAAATGTPIPVMDLDRQAPQRVLSSGAVPPFRGAQLRTWARQCLAARTGLVSSQVWLPGTINARLLFGPEIEVTDIMSLPETGLSAADLDDWLLDHAREHRVQIGGMGLRELLFQDGHPAGAIIDGPTGRRVVWTRHGVMLGTGSVSAPTELSRPSVQLPAGTRLCLVSRYASRFYQLELVRDQDLPSSHRPTCRNLPRSARQHRNRLVHRGCDVSRPRRWQLSHRRGNL
ncbi:MAG: hypothetical protein ABWY45_16625 [Mycobacterium sp.]